jgi:competence protein ComEC
LVFFILGIIFSELVLLPDKMEYVLFVIIPFITILLYFRSHSISRELFNGASISLIFLLLGFAWSAHLRYRPIDLPLGKYKVVVDEYPTLAGKYFRSLVKTRSNMKVLAYFEKSENIKSLQPGMQLVIYGKPQLIKNRVYPFEFNYQQYSRRKGIGHRIYLKKDDYELLSCKVHSLKYDALIIRENILGRLAASGIKGEAFDVLSAITLGSRYNLDPETTRSFIKTGTIHVLAVSGGNVAVIYFFLYLLFGFLNKRKTLFLFALVILTGIWIYTFITGLSPSVLRAAVMFSFIVIGKNLKRNPDVYNSLASSAFILLFLQPALLFDAGFELSYAAVFSIVSIQPLLYKICFFRLWIMDKLWILFTVSVAAQIGTLPFSLWYFHQFPSYFWITNIVVVPFISIFLYLSILILLIAPVFSYIGFLMAQSLEWACNALLHFLHFAENLPFALIENIYLTPAQLFFGVVILLFIIFFLIYHRSGYLNLILLGLILFVLVNIESELKILFRKEIVICNSERKLLIGFTRARETIWLHEKSEGKVALDQIMKSYERNKRIKIRREVILTDLPINWSTPFLRGKDNFLNFCGLRVMLLSAERKKMKLPEVDIIISEIFLSRYKNNSELIYFQGSSPVVISQSKKASSERNISNEANFVEIKIGQKKKGKVNYTFKYQ